MNTPNKEDALAAELQSNAIINLIRRAQEKIDDEQESEHYNELNFNNEIARIECAFTQL